MNKIGFIGGGKMACAILKGIINSSVFENKNIFVSAKSENTINNIKNTFNVNTTLDNKNIVQDSDIVVLAVKPFILKDILNEIKPYTNKKQLIISIAAGISIETIGDILGEIPIIRVMPNTPSVVNEGMSVIVKGRYAEDYHLKEAYKIFNSIGKTLETEEKFIDIVTAISGSGPSFYYYVINEIAKAGEKLGMDYETCLKLSAQTALGAAKMVLESGTNPKQLIKNVTTKGGCTEVGNKILEDNNLSNILFDTIEKTAQKAYELGKN